MGAVASARRLCRSNRRGGFEILELRCLLSCTPESPDLNDDHFVDAADATILFESWSASTKLGSFLQADFNGDQYVDASDADVLLRSFSTDQSGPVRTETTAQTTRYFLPPGRTPCQLVGHTQSGELTGFSPDGRWMHLGWSDFQNDRHWIFVDTTNGTSRIMHDLDSKQGLNFSYIQWTERNNYLRFRKDSAGVTLLEEVSPITGQVYGNAIALPRVTEATLNVTASQHNGLQFQTALGDRLTLETGESSGSDGIYLVEKAAYAGHSPYPASHPGTPYERWFLTVINTKNGLSVQSHFEFDRQVHSRALSATVTPIHGESTFTSQGISYLNDARENRWRELYFTNGYFFAHLSPYGYGGQGTDNTGRDVNFRFRADGTGWTKVAEPVSQSRSVNTDQWVHRALQTVQINNTPTTWVAYSTGQRADPYHYYLIVANPATGQDIAKWAIDTTDGKSSSPRINNLEVQHIQFHTVTGVPDQYVLVFDAHDVITGEGHVYQTILKPDSSAASGWSLTTPQIVADVSGATNVGDNFLGWPRAFTDGNGNVCWHTNEIPTWQPNQVIPPEQTPFTFSVFDRGIQRIYELPLQVSDFRTGATFDDTEKGRGYVAWDAQWKANQRITPAQTPYTFSMTEGGRLTLYEIPRQWSDFIMGSTWNANEKMRYLPVTFVSVDCTHVPLAVSGLSGASLLGPIPLMAAIPVSPATNTLATNESTDDDLPHDDQHEPSIEAHDVAITELVAALPRRNRRQERNTARSSLTKAAWNFGEEFSLREIGRMWQG